MIQYIKKPLCCGFFCFTLSVHVSLAQFSSGKYAVYYTDKLGCESVLESPEQYLSPRCLTRRAKHRTTVGCEDIPVNQAYISTTQELAQHTPIVSSKWLNASVFVITTEDSYRAIAALPFVDSLQLIERSDTASPVLKSSVDAKFVSEMTDDEASPSTSSALRFIHADYLNHIGFAGQNVLVAVFDGGFVSADRSSAFQTIFADSRVIQTHDFVAPDSAVFHSTVHGTAVWGLIAGVGNDVPIGAASKASYCLYRTEDVVHESKIEEFYWAVGMERADSVGVDVVNSSLGYCEFDDSLTNYTYANFDGAKSIVSRIAKMAWDRGILVVNSAGNEGKRPWHYTIFPAEVPEILTVGGVDNLQNPSYFTSEGFRQIAGVKPDVAALGEKVVTVLGDGTIGVIGNGTSFSAPAVAGGAACLIGAFPGATNDEIKSAIVQSSSLYPQPNVWSGYGIPDFRKAFLILQNARLYQMDGFVLYPNPAQASAYVLYHGQPCGAASVELRNCLGELVYRHDEEESGMLEEILLPLFDIGVSRGVYSVSVRTAGWCAAQTLIVE